MMKNPIRSLATILTLALAAGQPPPVRSQSKHWREIKAESLRAFDWNCAAPSAYPKARLSRLVRDSARRERVEVDAEADRAFAFDLNGDRKHEYFVPLACGATGNCDWGVFALNPARFMGIVNGQYVYVHRRTGRWPNVITYGRFSAAEGSVGTYGFREGRYVSLGDTYPTDVRGGIYGNKVPRFLERARAACEKVGH